MGCTNSKDIPDQNIYYPPSFRAPHIFRERYRILQELGKGAVATVKLCENRQTGEKVAVKIIYKNDQLAAADEIACKQEADLLKSIHHSNIIQCLDFFDEKDAYYMVLEYLEGGELIRRLTKLTVYSEKNARDVVKQVLKALKYCHDRNIVHRDLKPENLMLTSDADDADIKIIDFGYSSKHGDNPMRTQLGTPNFIAPEILSQTPSYGKGVDMWSLGCITFLLLGGYLPFQDNNVRKLFRRIQTGTYDFDKVKFANVSEEAKGFIRGLLTVDPSKRLSADDALEHPWLQLDDELLSHSSLEVSLVSIRENFSGKRRFRSAVYSIMAINKMQALSKDSSRESL